MLRVFQLEPTSGLLWRRTLKNYEVHHCLIVLHGALADGLAARRSVLSCMAMDSLPLAADMT